MTFELINTLDSVAKERISSFLDSLTEERIFFKLPKSKVIEAEYVIFENINGQDVGMVGVRKAFIIPIPFVIVKKQYQGKTIGKRLLEENLRIAATKYHFEIPTVGAENRVIVLKNLNMNHRKFLGIVDGRYYFYHPFDRIGEVLFYLSKIMFWIAMPIFSIRKNFSSIKC